MKEVILSGNPLINTKYNHGPLIKYEDIPEEEKEQALKEFSENSIGLEKCLRTMWDNNLITKACGFGRPDSYGEAYIMMEEGIDVFKFLSIDLLDDMMTIEEANNCEIVRFLGNPDERDILLLKLAQDILTGSKDNKKEIEIKLHGIEMGGEWKNLAENNSIDISTMTEEEFTHVQVRLQELGKILRSGEEEEIRKIEDEYVFLTGILLQKTIYNNEVERKGTK